MDNKTKILIAFPIILIIILVFVASNIHFEEDLSDAERQILEFTPSDLMIKETKRNYISKDFKSPFNNNLRRVIKDAKPKGDLVSQMGYNDKNLSLIVISGKRKIAIIEGVIVKEGDTFKGMRISKIEPGRVLLKNRTSQWLYLEK